MLKEEPCFECGETAEHQHHVVPQSRGGTRTLPLCSPCHGVIHEAPLSTRQLVREGIARARAKGTPWGKKRRLDFDVIVRMLAEGISASAIAKQLGISYWSVNSVRRTSRK